MRFYFIESRYRGLSEYYLTRGESAEAVAVKFAQDEDQYAHITVSEVNMDRLDINEMGGVWAMGDDRYAWRPDYLGPDHYEMTVFTCAPGVKREG